MEYALTTNGAAVYRLRDHLAIYTDYLDTDLAAEFDGTDAGSWSCWPPSLPTARGYAVDRQMSLLPRLPLARARQGLSPHQPQPAEGPGVLDPAAGQGGKFSLNFVHGPDGQWVDYDKLKVVLADHPDLSVVSGGTDNLEITSPTATKGDGAAGPGGLSGDPQGADHGLRRLGERPGDAEGRWLSVAMANCEDCIRPYVDAVTGSNEEDGVAQAITSTFSLKRPGDALHQQCIPYLCRF